MKRKIDTKNESEKRRKENKRRIIERKEECREMPAY